MEKLLHNLSEYNVWKGEYLPEGFRRVTYLKKIYGMINTAVIKVLIGQRRVGKSYLLRQIINSLVRDFSVPPVNIFYLNKEQLVFDEIVDVKKLDLLFRLYLSTYKPKGKVYIFLDEIQTIDQWEKFVTSYSQDINQEFEVFITGSNSQILSSELSTLLSGRYVEMKIFPFSYEEFTDYLNVTVNRESFIEYLKTGGLPELFNFKSFEAQMYYVESLKNTIILKDIVERHKIKDVNLLELIFRFIMLNIGNLTSVNAIVKYFKSTGKRVNFETVSDYTAYLLQSMVLHSSERIHLKTKQILRGERKFYLNDMSFRNFLYGERYFDPAAYLENHVFLKLLDKGYQVFTGAFRDGEIDFVALKANERHYFQVSYLLESEKTLKRETENLLRIKDNFPKFLITMDAVSRLNINGIEHILAWELDKRLSTG